MRPRSHKDLKPSHGYHFRRIERRYRRVELEKGEAAEEKVLQVLEGWQGQGLILCYSRSPRGGYDDCVRHVDGSFVALDGELVEFQIKSSYPAAQKHLREHPDIKAIVVRPGVALDALSDEMKSLFGAKLSTTL